MASMQAPSFRRLRPLAGALALALAAPLAAPAFAQEESPAEEAPPPGRRRLPAKVRRTGDPTDPDAPAPAGPTLANPGRKQFPPKPKVPGATTGSNGLPPAPPSKPVNRPSIVPSTQATPLKPAAAPAKAARPIAPAPARAGGPPPVITPIDKKTAGQNSKTVQMNFDKRDLAEVIQFVANFTQRNFILPERVSGKITILSNAPIPADEVWNVFVAALDSNNWAVYPVGRYWKLSEKKQSARANIPTFLEAGQDTPATEQMVTKLFKLRYVEADQMRNTINQFTSRDSDFQIFPPDTLIISDLGLNMRRLQRLIEQLDQPGGTEEIHIVQAQYGSATELAQKLNEIFQAQQTKQPGGQKQIGVAEPILPGAPPMPSFATGQAQPAASQGPLTVSKILADDRTNKLIVVANSRSFMRVMELLKQLDVPSTGGGVHVYYLENAKAEEVANTLQALAQGASSSGRRKGAGAGAAVPPPSGAGGGATADLFSGEVKITADKNTNSLVIIASASDYRSVVKVIERLDIRRRQVFVEAVIMEVNLQNESDIGVSMHGGSVLDNISFRGAKGSAPVVIGSQLGGLSSLGGVASLGSLGGFLAGLQGPPITVSGLTLPSFAILLNAMQKSSDVNVVSTPTVIMTDNSEGEITVGQNVPFQAGYSPQSSALSQVAGAAGGTATSSALGSLVGLGGLGSLYAPIQRQNVELKLKIKPQINEGDMVRLEIDEQTEEIAEVDKTLGPTTSKRAAKTTVVARDQETVVLGGLIQERTIKGVSKIPVLGSIPLIGWLFRSEQTKKTKTNLLLFLTPYIIRDQADFRRIFERKMAERAEFVKRFTGEDASADTVVDYTRKPGPLARVRRALDVEMSRAENGGLGAADEKVIAPATAPATAAPAGETKAPAPKPAAPPPPPPAARQDDDDPRRDPEAAEPPPPGPPATVPAPEAEPLAPPPAEPSPK